MEEIYPAYRVPVEEKEMSIKILTEAGQNVLRGKKTISKGCKENVKTSGTVKTAQKRRYVSMRQRS